MGFRTFQEGWRVTCKLASWFYCLKLLLTLPSYDKFTGTVYTYKCCGPIMTSTFVLFLSVHVISLNLFTGEV
jgi:hypothetical protein